MHFPDATSKVKGIARREAAGGAELHPTSSPGAYCDTERVKRRSSPGLAFGEHAASGPALDTPPIAGNQVITCVMSTQNDV